MQAALTNVPQSRPGLTVEAVMEDELILVAACEAAGMAEVSGSDVFVDWGSEFTQAHALDLPHLQRRGVTLSLGALAAEYVVNRRAAAYLPARAVHRHLERGRLHPVPNAPRFADPVWAVYRDDLSEDLTPAARATLTQVATSAETFQEQVMALRTARRSVCWARGEPVRPPVAPPPRHRPCR